VSGPQGFTQPIYSRSPILDGVELNALFGSWEKSPLAASVFPLQMGDGRAIVQSVARTTNDPEAPVAWQWVLPDEATTEADWQQIEAVMSRGRVVSWIPHDYETETFVLPAGARTITLRRATAVSVYPSFPVGALADSVTVDGVAQTIVDTGTPASGEVRLEADELEVPSDTSAGAVLVLRYYPAYRVFLPRVGMVQAAWNDVKRDVLMLEVQE
jgi:hypothetical protein